MLLSKYPAIILSLSISARVSELGKDRVEGLGGSVGPFFMTILKKWQSQEVHAYVLIDVPSVDEKLDLTQMENFDAYECQGQ